MKRYLPLIAALILSPAPFIIPAVASATELIAVEIAPELKSYAKSISVKIDSNNNGGSGVIIGKQDNLYLVITNQHVVQGGDSFTIQTADGTTHAAEIVSNPITSDDDIALLTFNSDNNYQVTNLNSAATGRTEQKILAVGYSVETGEFKIEEGTINRIPNQPFKEGYQIGYNSNIVSGMSGGAILNVFGDLIGINGRSAFPILNTGYEYQDGTIPSAEEIEQLRQLSWGLSLHRLLTQVNPEIITAYNLPLPETVANIGKTQLTGWLAELEAKAQQITVRIDSSSGINGSGIIVAKEGNTYGVLTADHVICEKDRETRKCIDYDYEIVAPDGNKYSVKSKTIRRQEGVDLAVVWFTSTEEYQVAELANYPVIIDDAVFVAGYPKLSHHQPAQWRLGLGYGLDRESGLLNVTDDSLSRDSSDLTSSQNSLSGGYEMVYTSITYRGMSGGAVLDRDGRVIGIHGLAEGETAFNSQSSSATQIQLGYSLGIPINTFIGLAKRFKIDSKLLVQDSRPRGLNTTEAKALGNAILETKIPQGNATAEIWLERGNQLWRLHRYSEAVAAFDKAIDLNPEFIHLAYYGKGLALWYRGENEAALANFSLATETEPNFGSAFVKKSALLQKLNRYEEALVAIEKAISLQQDHANLYSEKGFILSNLKRYSEAEAAYQEAIEISPRAAFYNNRGLIYSYQGKLNLALADYNRAIELDPEFALAYNNRGLLYFNQGKVELALANFNQALSVNPEFALAYISRGFIYLNQGKAELALAEFNQAIELDPQLAMAHLNRGFIYFNQGKVELALADWNQAIEIDPQLTMAYLNRGALYFNQGNEELALADVNQALSINPKYTKAYLLRGNIYFKQGKTELALADVNQALSINSKFALAYFARALIYHKQENFARALSDYNQALSLDKDYTIVINYEQIATKNIGLIKYELGAIEEAKQQFEQAINLEDKDKSAESQLALAVTLFTSGDTEKALSMAETALNLDKQHAEVEHLKEDHLWGEKLIADTEKLLAHPKIQALLAQP